MPTIFKKLFSQKIVAQSEFRYEEQLLDDSIKENRKSLSEVKDWIDEDAFENSFFSYGVPDFIKNDINKPLDSAITYTDVMLYISRKHLEKVNYLEIGVSVGKNFFQLLNACNKGAKLSGFDIEEINPVVEKRLALKEKTEWDTPKGSIKKTLSSLKKYDFGGVEVNYLCADIWDENSWGKLKGNKFNMIFSDALHTPKAILFEFEMMVKYELLDETFIIVWDDLVGKMRHSFYKIIKKYDKKYQIKDIYLLNINGWVGQHEPPHSVGIISNFSL